ncbi:unnamed protein product [Rotaria sp. Silwood1]|nr:unnamed protein product [Rotaria sp. Silwood1]
MYNAVCSQPSCSHQSSQDPPGNNTMSNEQCPSNTSAVHMNFQNYPAQQILVPPFQTSHHLTYLPNQTYPTTISNNNISNQHSILNYPHITPLLHQHPMPMVHNQLSHQLSSTNSTYSSPNNNIIHHDHNTSNQQQINQFQSQIVAVSMESENDDNFITVSRKKKKAKMDHVQFRIPSTTTSAISTTNTDCSTSSTNTSSITTNVLPANNFHSQTNSSKTNGLYARFNTKP